MQYETSVLSLRFKINMISSIIYQILICDFDSYNTIVQNELKQINCGKYEKKNSSLVSGILRSKKMKSKKLFHFHVFYSVLYPSFLTSEPDHHVIKVSRCNLFHCIEPF